MTTKSTTKKSAAPAKPAAKKSTTKPVAAAAKKTSTKPAAAAAKKSTTKPAAAAAATKRASAPRMTDAELTAAITKLIKSDSSYAKSWTKTLRKLRADGIGGGGHVRFRELHAAVAAKS